jgi:L-fucose isomerase-like protein
MPIGEVTSEDIKNDIKSAIENLESINVDLTKTKPLYDEKDIILAVKNLQSAEIDLLILFSLHGASAPLLVLAAENSVVRTVIWALPTRYSLPTCASAIGALMERDFKSNLVYGSASDKEVTRRIEQLARVNYTINRLKRARIGAIGGVFSLMTASYYDRNILRHRIGPDIVRIPISEYKQVVTKTTEKEAAKAIENIPKGIKVEVEPALLVQSMRQHLALKKIANERELEGFCLECHSEMIKEFKVNPCLGFIDESYTIGCEGDVVTCAAALMILYLSGKQPLISDPFTIDSESVMTMLHCAGPASLCEDCSDVTIKTGHSPSHVGEPIPLAMCRPKLQEGKEVTLLRLYGSHMDKMHFALGNVVSCLNQTTLDIRIRLVGGKDAFIRNISGNHYIVASGDIRNDLKVLCEQMGIEAIES